MRVARPADHELAGFQVIAAVLFSAQEEDVFFLLIGGCDLKGLYICRGNAFDSFYDIMKFSDNRYAVLEWGSAFHWPEHYLLIQGTKGAIRLDMFDAGVTLKMDGKEVHTLLHENEAEDANRTAIYHGTEMDGAIQYGNPDKVPPLWLHGLIIKEMKYLNDLMHGMKPTKEFEKLLNGVAAREAIATADACTKSCREGRVVKMEEIL